MEFTLTYRGRLGSNKGAVEKFRLRRIFHAQLAILWTQLPLTSYHEFIIVEVPHVTHSLLRPVGGFIFAPLVSPTLGLVAELRITLLRPEAPGALITQGGDIDNRLKTLLDALRMPSVASEIPKGENPTDEERPFFSLLEDDNLVTKIDVTTDRLLEKVESPSEVLLLIHVTIKRTHGTYKNIGF